MLNITTPRPTESHPVAAAPPAKVPAQISHITEEDSHTKQSNTAAPKPLNLDIFKKLIKPIQKPTNPSPKRKLKSMKKVATMDAKQIEEVLTNAK